MVALTKRLVKGSPLTNAEGDANLDALNGKMELVKAGTASPPSTPYVGLEWFDTDSGIKYTWTGSEWAELDAGTILGSMASKGLTIETPSPTENITFFYTPSALSITSVVMMVVGTTPSVTYSLKSASDRTSGSPTVHVSDSVANNTTSGSQATIANASIAAGSWVWLTTSATSGTVDNIHIVVGF